MSCQMPVWINYVFGRGRHLDRGCDKWRQKKHKPKYKQLADRSLLRRRGGRKGEQSKKGSGHDQGVVEHVKHWAIKFATCSHVHSWAEAAVAMMVAKATELAGRGTESESKRQFPHVLPAMCPTNYPLPQSVRSRNSAKQKDETNVACA